MAPRGKFIAIEGVDGAGKRTQIELLSRVLSARGLPHARLSFPRYHSFFGQMVARYLNGQFGRLGEVDPHFSALLFAGDRLEAKAELEAALAQGKTLVADRYVGSNLAHQAARVSPDDRDEFVRWLKKLEYEIYRLPAEDLVVYLRLPAIEAQRLVGSKAARDYTTLRRDLQEADLAHLEAAALVYDRLAKEPNWVTIECFDAAGKALRPPEAIHRELLASVDARVLHLASTA